MMVHMAIFLCEADSSHNIQVDTNQTSLSDSLSVKNQTLKMGNLSLPTPFQAGIVSSDWSPDEWKAFLVTW